MSRTFHHYLYVVIPRSLGELAQTNQLLNLAYVGCVGQTSRTASVSQGYGNVVLLTNVQDFIVVFVERVLVSGHAHPCKNKTSATADDVHLSLVFPNLLDGFPSDSAVQCDEVYTVLCVKADNIHEILCRQCGQVSLIVNDTVVYRDGSDHYRAFRCEFLTERLSVSVAGQVHNRFGAQVHCAHHLLHLNVVVFAVSGYAEVDIDLGAKHASNTFCR